VAQAAQLKIFSKAQCHKKRGKLLENLTEANNTIRALEEYS